MGPPTGTTCPSDGTTLTYENFGKQFATDYCVGCHSSKLTTKAARNGATEGHDFDTLAGIDLVKEHIDPLAGSGPKSTNEMMPPPASSGKKPTEEEREKLAVWLACGPE